MFTPKLNTSKSYSPFGQPHSGSKRGQIFTPEKRSNFPVFRKSANTSLLHTSVIVEQTSRHVLEEYGTALPVQVTEALTSADRTTEVNVRVEPSGWAALVFSSKLFLWRFKGAHIGKANLCRELPLPPSEHPSSLIAVISSGDNPSAPISCVTVTPEGVVRYWINIAHSGAFAESIVDLKGEECAQLIQLPAGQCVVATTTSSLVLLTPTSQGQVSCKVLKEQSSVYAGIGRRMSSFLFGAGAPPGAGLPLRRLMLGEVLSDGGQSVYVLSGTQLCKWAIYSSYEKVLYQCNVDRMLQECVADSIWNQDFAKLPGLKTWLVDMCNTGDGLVVLGAAVNEETGPRIHYSLGILHTEGADPPQSFLSFNVSGHSEMLEWAGLKPRSVVRTKEGQEKFVLRHRVMLPNPSVSSVYMYDEKSVLCLSVSSADQGVDRVEFQAPGDRILGAGVSDNEALFFSNNHGFVCLRRLKSKAEAAAEASLSESMMSQTVQEQSAFGMSMSKVEEISTSEDPTHRLKAAFIYFCKGNMEQSRKLIGELFPVGGTQSDMDKRVILLSQEMVDDFPASDPRWAESVPQDAASSSSSLILLHQLEDKLKVHEYFINFLKDSGLWERLSAVKRKDSLVSTRTILCEHAEKISAAMALRTLHIQHRGVVDRAVRHVLEQRGETVPPSGLTPQDVFYRHVSRIDHVLEALQLHESEVLGADVSPADVVSTVSTVNAIFCSMLHDAWQYRQSKSGLYECARPSRESVPWTASSGPRGVRTQLFQQHHLTVEAAIPAAHDAQQKGALLQQLVQLTDLVLDGYKTEIEAVNQSAPDSAKLQELRHRYETDREALIKPFMTMTQYERAASLAEKYCDFGTLVQLCEDTNNEERLNRYMNQFQSRSEVGVMCQILYVLCSALQGFHDFVFRYYMEAGRRGKLLASLVAAHPQLGRLLNAEGNEYLSWLHDIGTNSMWKAHETLSQLAMKETEFVGKKKTLLSLSKLAALATEEPPTDLDSRTTAINEELDLILHQETLPDDVVRGFGMSPDNMKVLTPQQLIELYTSDYNRSANCYDFKKSLDLLQYIDKTDKDSDYDLLLLHIWCKAILRDRWGDISTDDPMESCKDTVFFKTLELAYTEGMDLREFLPPSEKLLEAAELGDLRHKANFQYLIKAGYEQVQRILS